MRFYDHILVLLLRQLECYYLYVSHYYKKATYIATYSWKIHHVGSKYHWDIPDSIVDEVVIVPIEKVQVGRLKRERERIHVAGKPTMYENYNNPRCMRTI